MLPQVSCSDIHQPCCRAMRGLSPEPDGGTVCTRYSGIIALYLKKYRNYKYMELSLLADLWEYLAVEKHVPGRLSLKVDLAVRNHPKAATLSRSGVSGLAAIRKTRLNIFTRTLVVEYDTALLPFERLDGLLRCPDTDSMRAMAQQISLA